MEEKNYLQKRQMFTLCAFRLSLSVQLLQWVLHHVVQKALALLMGGLVSSFSPFLLF